MEHVAIDLGSKESHVCRRDPSGTIIESQRLKTRRLERYLSGLPPSRVILETCAEAFHVADMAKELGHEVRVVPATLVRSLGVGSRGVKTDERDAMNLSEASCRIELPSVHVPSALARDLKSLSATRERLIAARTMLINNVRGWLRTHGIRVHGRYSTTFSVRLEAAIEGEQELPTHIKGTLEVIEAMTVKITELDAALVAIVKGSELYQRMMTVPGVGPVTVIRFVAALDEVDRFASVRALRSFTGLTPGEHSSGTRVRRTGITKAGPAELRRVLVQGAWCALRSRKHQNDPMIGWARQIQHRRGMNIAVVALARKMAGILFAIWRDGTRYDPSRGAKKSNG